MKLGINTDKRFFIRVYSFHPWLSLFTSPGGPEQTSHFGRFGGKWKANVNAIIVWLAHMPGHTRSR
jgi:hypothetical protein